MAFKNVETDTPLATLEECAVFALNYIYDSGLPLNASLVAINNWFENNPGAPVLNPGGARFTEV